MPLERFEFVRRMRRELNMQLANVEGYWTETNPVEELRSIMKRKTDVLSEILEQTQELRKVPNGHGGPTTRARLIHGQGLADIKRKLLSGDAPGHEYVLCAGLMLIGHGGELEMLKELMGL
ncbi:hypothetical protein D3C81_1692940 [compost metagenome]